MKLYTKRGDNGTTALLGGGSVLKSSPKIESYGNIDELNSWIGNIRDGSELETDVLLKVQKKLFIIGSWLSLNSRNDAYTYKLTPITSTDIEELEHHIDKMTEAVPPLTNFILPGGHDLVSKIHIARTVCRRAERGVVAIYAEEELYETIMIYLNRLSDYLFALARYTAHHLNVGEILWSGKDS